MVAQLDQLVAVVGVVGSSRMTITNGSLGAMVARLVAVVRVVGVVVSPKAQLVVVVGAGVEIRTIIVC